MWQIYKTPKLSCKWQIMIEWQIYQNILKSKAIYIISKVIFGDTINKQLDLQVQDFEKIEDP